MESALNGLASTSKHSATKEAVAQAREAVKNGREKGDVPVSYIREKCLTAIELAFDHGNEKTAHHAVEAVQALLRDKRFHSMEIENPQHNLPTQVLHSMTGIAQWNHQLQCHCLTLLVEMICSSELRVALQEVEESLELCMRVFGASKEESVRVSARAAVSQSITSYFFNRYAAGEESQDLIAVYLDVTKLLESYVAKLDQLTTSNDQSVVLFEATNALLTAQPLTIQTHTPFVNLLWEKLCPLMIRLLGVPDKNITSTVAMSTEEPVGQGQINKFPLSPAVIANPEATRALYQILDQLVRIMASIPSVSSVLEALFHRAFLFPKIEQRTEAIKIIRKIVSDPRRIADLVESATSSRSLSLWRMIVVCCLESSCPNYEISIDAVRAAGCMLQGILDFSRSTQLLTEETKCQLREMFASLEDSTTTSFTARSDVGNHSPRPSTETESRRETTDNETTDDEMAATLKKLTQKFGLERMSEDDVGGPKAISQRRTTEYDETSEKVTAEKFVDALTDKIRDWKRERSTLNVDHVILEFAASFYSDFSAVHNEVFKSKSKVQQEFLNTDAIYLTAHASLSLLLRGSEKVTWLKFKESVLSSGCIVYVSESWLQKVYDHILSAEVEEISGHLKEVIQDYDGFDCKLLSDVERLQTITKGGHMSQPYEERLAARWFITAAWNSIVSILSTFLGIKERRKARSKVVEGIEYSINGIQLLATVALELELGDRCGWIFDNLVEASCDVESLRTTATTEEQKRWSIIGRCDLLSIQMVLDNAFVAVHAPDCWKHVIRCTEFVWELEKYIYGALCYEKPQRFSFGRKKTVEKQENKAEEGLSCAERSVERALGDRELTKDNINKALAVLIAKVDRFYSQCGHQLNLRSLRQLCISLVGASENRIFYSEMKAPSLTPSINLLERISEVLGPLSTRPLVHQMLVWPVVGAHFIQVACSVEESRCGISALSECVASLLLAESNGMCFNQMLLAPFQAIVCSDSCSPETREQLVSSISDYVRTKSDTLGSGWKPLFGTLRAVRTATLEDASVHWTVLDVIGTYLGIKKSCVLSWSLPDCFPCIVHFLQSTDTDAKELDDQLSEAALRIVQPTYAVILNLYRTPHIPNHNLLHRSDLRSYSIEEVEARVACLDPTESLVSPLSSIIDPTFYAHNADDPSPIELDADLDVSLGPLPWSDREAHETSAIELILSFVEQLCGTLVTAPPLVQPPLLRTIHQLLTTIKDSEFGHDTAAFCISALLLPYIQKWLRRLGETDDGRNIKQAVGTCTQIVLEFVEGCETSAWSTRLLSDACRLAVECTAQPKDLSRVGAACLRHLATAAPHFEEPQWTILQKAMWDACTVTLHPIRILTSFYLSDSSDEKGDLGHVLIDSEGDLPPMQRILAQQVFLLDSQREESEMELGEGSPAGRVDLVLMKDGAKHRIPLPLVVSSLLAHQLILQLLGSLLSPKVVPPEMSRILATAAPIEVLDKVSARTRAMLFYCLDASFQVSRDVDSRRGLTAILAKSSEISQPNLFKQLISAGMIKLNALFACGRQEGHTTEMCQLNSCLRRVIGELRHIEQRTAAQRMAAAAREHREEKLEFMLVEVDGEKLYKVVDETEVNNTITEYQKQRPLGAKPVKERKNPFMGSLSTEENNVIKTAKVDVNTLRLLSYRDICMMPIQLLLRDENRKQLLPTLIGSIKALILATPDLSVRNLAVELIEILAE